MSRAVSDSITGLILAGGEGAPVAGADMGLLELHGLPLVEHVLGRLAPQVSSAMISANRNIDRYQTLVPRVLRDGPGGVERFRGPLAGIQAGLAHAPTAWIAVVPCDAPQLPRALVARLADAVNSRGSLAACARADGRLQSVFCLLHTSLGTSLAAYLEGGGRTVHAWLAEVGAIAVDFEDAAGFRSINTVEALAGGLR